MNLTIYTCIVYVSLLVGRLTIMNEVLNFEANTNAYTKSLIVVTR